ncbi:DNA polymerase V, partial [Acinetobacter baumannii]
MSNSRGGSRDGSGRKFKYNEPTKTVRVPVSKIIEIKNYLNEVEKQRFNE